jgi:hypothetical protein
VNDAALLIRWALIVLGTVYFLTESAIFAPVRVWIAGRGVFAMTLIYCASCTGFWVGLALASWFWPFGLVDAGWTQIIEGGVASMALGALYSAWKGGNPAFDVEAPLHDHTKPEEARDSRAEESNHAEG